MMNSRFFIRRLLWALGFIGLLASPLQTFADTALESNTDAAVHTSIPRVTTRALRVGLVVDSLFNDYHAGRGVARALSIMNGVDAIFQKELGLAIEVVAVRDYSDAATDPFRLIEADVGNVLMPLLRETRRTDPLFADDLSLVHMFSGHFHQGSITTVGLAWLNSVCNPDGFDVSVSTPFLFDTLLTAHEIAHTLGAPHDDNPACAAFQTADDNALMWPKITGFTKDEFSACSVNSIQGSMLAECAVDVVDVAISLNAVAAANSLEHQVTLLVENQDVSRSVSMVGSRTQLPANSELVATPNNCALQNSELVCEHGTLAPRQSSLSQLTVRLKDNNERRVRSELTLPGIVDRERQNNVAQLDLLNMSAGAGADSGNEAASDRPAEEVSVNSNSGNEASANGAASSIGLSKLSPIFIVLVLVVSGYRVAREAD